MSLLIGGAAMRMLPRYLAALLVAAIPATAAAQARPNLEVVSVEAPIDGVAGGLSHLAFEVAVRGTPPPSFSWSAHLTQRGALQGSLQIGTFGPVRPTQEGTVRVELDVTLPAAPTGSYVLAIAVDPQSAVAESNEYDNVLAAPAATRVRVPTADLRVLAVRVLDPERRSGEAVRVELELRNAGETDATTEVAALASKDNGVSISDFELGRSTVNVPAGATITTTIDGVVPALSPGDYAIGVFADPAQSLTEVEEIENLRVASDALNVFTDTLQFTTQDLPNATVFIPYFAKLVAEGGDGHHQFFVSAGRVPEGLRLDPVSGEIRGTPLESGSIQADIEVRSNGLITTKTFTVLVRESGVELAIVTPSLDSATLGLPYQGPLIAAGGEPPYRWSVRSGAVPPGLDLGLDGWLRGVPLQEGHFSFVAEVRDALGGAITGEFSIDVEAPNVAVLSGDLPAKPVGEPTTIRLEVTGGVPPYEWDALSAPPPGLTLSEDGLLSGVPSMVGRYAMRVRVTDSSRAKREDTSLLQLEIHDAGTFEIVTQSLPAITVREPLDIAIELNGGAQPFTWRLAPGDSIPSGFQLVTDDAGNARITGTSLRPIEQAFTLIVEDSAGRTREAVLALEVKRFEGAAASGCRCVANSGTSALWLLAGLALLLFKRR